MEYYRLPLYILFGVLPSLVWLFYYLKKDLNPEPKKMIVKVFFYGALITIPTFFLQITLVNLLEQLHFLNLSPFIIEILKWFIIIALTEEFLKYLVVRLAVFNSSEMDEPLDVMLYMVVSALGFTAVENVLYLFSPIDNISFQSIIKTAVTVSFIRFIGATFLHTLCSALFGYFLALSFIRSKNKVMLSLTGLFLATFLHGLYNFSIIVLRGPWNFIIPIIVILGLIIFMTYDFDEIKKIKSICKI